MRTLGTVRDPLYMLNAILSWSLHNRLVVIFGWVGLCVAGALALQSLPIDAFPDTTPVQVQITSIAPALAAEEVERQITFPIEQAISGLPNLAEVRSTSEVRAVASHRHL